MIKRLDATSSASLCHLFSLVAPLATVFGYVSERPLLGAFLVLVVYPLLDLLLGVTRQKSATTRLPYPHLLLYLHVIAHTAVVFTLCQYADRHALSWATAGAVLSAGVSSGISGIIVAHELGHSRAHWIDPWLARWNLLLVLYSHFTLEHNRHHHPAVATVDDPASAPRERNLWQQLVFTIPQQFKSAWRIATKRRAPLGLNTVIWGLSAQVLLIVIVGLMFSIGACVALVAQALFSIFLLEYVNYIRHYGLRRDSSQRVNEQHAWQSESRWSRWTLLELTRHPSHHIHAGLPFWELRPYADAPSLPAGYYAMFWPALFPAWWRRLMTPLLDQR